jgi:hypothetical protein
MERTLINTPVITMTGSVAPTHTPGGDFALVDSPFRQLTH